MDFTWWVLLSKWAKDAGLSPLSTAFIALGVALLIYCGNILKGIKQGYGVILQDQKDATTSLRDQVKAERENSGDISHELGLCREELVVLLRALAVAKMTLAAHGIDIPPSVTSALAAPPPAPSAPPTKGT